MVVHSWCRFKSNHIVDKTEVLFVVHHVLKGFPVQKNTSDCGVFVYMHAVYNSLQLPYDFDQSHMSKARFWTASVICE
jgi:Ulp1 family protease